MGRAAGRLDLLYARAVTAQNWRLALQIVRTAAQLFGLNAATEIRHSGDAESPIAFRNLSHFSEADLAEAARLASLVGKEESQ